jgi:hypothetical protein
MTVCLKHISLIPVVLFGIFVTGCAGPVSLNVNYQPIAKAQTPLASVSSLQIKLMNLVDKRGGTGTKLIGSREAEFGVSLGEVYSTRPVLEIVHDAIESELIRNGHNIGVKGEDIVFSGELHKFWVRTDVTPLYWDVVGEVKIVLELKNPEGDTLISTRSYRASNVERTFTWPSKKIMEHVLVKSLDRTG